MDVVIRLPQAPPHDYMRWVEWWNEVDQFATSSERGIEGPTPGPLASRLVPVNVCLTNAQARTAMLREAPLVAPQLGATNGMWEQSVDFGLRRRGWIEELAGSGIDVPAFPSDLVGLRERALRSIRSSLSEGGVTTPSGLVVIPRESPGYLRAVGELDLTTVDQMREVCEMELDEGLRLDLSGITFIDSQGLRLLIRLGLLASERDARAIVIESPSRVVARLLELTVPRGLPGVEIVGEADEPPSPEG